MTHQHPILIARQKRLPKVDRSTLLWRLQLVDEGKRPTLRHIMLAVEKETGVPLEVLLSPSRRPKHVRARHMCFWLARRFTGRSFPTIGRIARRDHSTVQYGVIKVQQKRHLFEPEISRLEAALTPRMQGLSPLTEPHIYTPSGWQEAMQ